MTYQSNYTLADKMQKQFRSRGQNMSGMHASSTSELMRRASMGKDPRVNCSEQAFRESYRAQRTGTASSRAYTSAYSQEGRSQKETNTYSREYRGQSPRSARPHRKAAEPAVKAERPAEIKMKQKAFPPLLLAMILIGTLMVMMMVFSISEVYQTTNQIEQLEDELAMLQSEADALRLQLEEKNDIRQIEEIATAELGMVKEDSVQRKYVSLSDGEYIELIATEEAEEDSAKGVMLSSIFASLGNLLERFK